MQYYVEKENVILSGAKVELTRDCAFLKNQCLVFAHLHRAIEILIILRGRFKIELGNTTDTVCGGDLVLIRPNTIHQIFSLDDGESDYLVYKIRPDLLLDFAEGDMGALYLLELNYRNGKNIWRADESDGGGLAPIIKMIISDYFNKPYAMDMSVKANAILLLTELLRSEEVATERADESISLSTMRKIYSAINLVNERFRDAITASDCALAVDMSYTHFSRSFKSVMGKPFTQYLNEVRINSAEKELFISDKSITEIAYSVGYNDVSYFISTYKKIKGVTPKRKRNGVSEKARG